MQDQPGLLVSHRHGRQALQRLIQWNQMLGQCPDGQPIGHLINRQRLLDGERAHATTLQRSEMSPDPERLAKASRHAERVVVLTCGSSQATWMKQHLSKLSTIPNLTLLGLEQEFLTKLVNRLERSISWSVTVTGGSIYLGLDDETLESSLVHVSGPEAFAP